MTRVGSAGSDDSTAIRSRPVPPTSTMDHITIPSPAAPNGDGPEAGSGAERARRGGAEA
jgi:hypothetical protein